MRLFVPDALAAVAANSGGAYTLPPGPTRHAQVRRVQPGDALVLFDGSGAEWPATVTAVGRSAVDVTLGAPVSVDRELPLALHHALVMPANDRMDALVEKATELGAAALQPLHGERSVLRLQGERAEKKRAHWQAIAEGAAEQCGRARVPQVAAVASIESWLKALPPPAPDEARWLLSFRPDALPLQQRWAASPGVSRLLTLNGPEGGLSPAEEDAALRAGFVATTLGARVLRADTAPLAVLAAVAAWTGR